MSLQARCSHAFSPVVRTRGKSYAVSGRISRVQMAGDRATAAAHGSELYELGIAFDREAQRVDLSCTCPYAYDDLCKHLWAFLLVLDRQFPGRLDPPGAGWLEVDLGDVESDDGIEGESDAIERRHGSPWNAAGRPAAASPPAARTTKATPKRPTGEPAAKPAATWRERLRSLDALLRRPTPAPGDRAELELRLDLQASRERGGLVVRFYHRRPRADGSLGSAQAVRLSRRSAARLPRVQDQHAVELLLACGFGEEPSSTYAAAEYREASSAVLEARTFLAVLPRLCATGRFGLVGDDGALRPLAWDGDRPFRLVLEVEPGSAAGRLRARGVLRRDDESIRVEDAQLAHVGGAVVLDDRIVLVEETRSARALVVARRARPGVLGGRRSEEGVPDRSGRDHVPLDRPAARHAGAGRVSRPDFRRRGPAAGRGGRPGRGAAPLAPTARADPGRGRHLVGRLPVRPRLSGSSGST